MESVNISIVISLAISTLTFLVLLFAFTKQWMEVVLPKDWLSGLRWIIFSVLAVSLAGVIPVIVYQAARLSGADNEVLRNFASVTGNISRLATAMLLVAIYTYKKKGD